MWCPSVRASPKIVSTSTIFFSEKMALSRSTMKKQSWLGCVGTVGTKKNPHKKKSQNKKSAPFLKGCGFFILRIFFYREEFL